MREKCFSEEQIIKALKSHEKEADIPVMASYNTLYLKQFYARVHSFISE